VAVHQHRLGAALASRARGIDFKEQHRRAPGQADHFKFQALNLLGLHPVGRVAQHGLDVAVRGPVRIEHRRLGRDFDVFFQRTQDAAVPGLGDIVKGACAVERGCRQ